MDPLNRFLKLYNSPKTISVYRSRLKEFLSLFYSNGSLEEQAERYFGEKRSYEEDIRAYFIHIKEKPPKTVDLGLAVVRGFLMENEVEFPQLFWRRLRGRKKGSRALTVDRVPTNAELRKILNYMPLQGKALFLLLSSSGMRIGEALSLTLSDFDLSKDPPEVTIRGEHTKTGNQRRVYISRETKEILEDWLRFRERYIEAAAAKSKPRAHYKQEFKGKSTEDPRLFPFEAQNAYVIWYNAITKAGFDSKDNGTNRYALHPHVLRKFFRTRLGAIISVDVVEALMGHEGYLTEVYRRYSERDLARFYKQGEHALLVFSNGAEISKLKEDIQQEKTHIQAFVDEFSKKVALENQEMRTKMAGVELENRELKAEIHEIKEDARRAGETLARLEKRLTEIGLK